MFFTDHKLVITFVEHGPCGWASRVLLHSNTCRLLHLLPIHYFFFWRMWVGCHAVASWMCSCTTQMRWPIAHRPTPHLSWRWWVSLYAEHVHPNLGCLMAQTPPLHPRSGTSPTPSLPGPSAGPGSQWACSQKAVVPPWWRRCIFEALPRTHTNN